MRILIRILVGNFIRKIVRFSLVGILVGLSYLISDGQTINEIKKLWQNNNLAFLDASSKEKLFTNADFSKYAGTRDDNFAAYLKETWSDYSILSGITDASQHPKVQPVFDESNLDMNPPVNLPFSSIFGLIDHGTSQTDRIPRIRKPESDTFNSLNKVFQFYGQQVSISYDKLIVLSKISSLSENSISGFWESFSRANSNHLVDQLMDYRDLLGLGDWGYFQLVKATANHIFVEDLLNADLLTWALMIRSGFDVRMAFNQNSTTVLFPSVNALYYKQFVVIGQKRFYLDRDMKSQLLVTNQNPFPDNVGLIDLNFYTSLNFNGKLAMRQFSFQWNKKNYLFSIRYNPEIIRFYKDYPQTDPSVYFGAPVSSTLKEDLLGQFYPVLSKMEKPEAAAFLQQFVQNKFDYVSDNQKNEFFPRRFSEEVIANKSGDDLSRSVLFSWMTRILLHLPVVGVNFTDYFSTAVCYDTNLDGNYYYLNGSKYYLTDPTALNAPIGVTLPELEGLTPQLIDLSGFFSQPDNDAKIWELALKLGARRGGTNKDIVFDRQGKALITGYFSDQRSSCFPFIACFSRGNSLQWIRKFEVNGKAVSFAITKTYDDEIFIAGSFCGKMVMDRHELQSENNKPDLFIAQFNQNGELVWMNKAGIDPTIDNESLTYMVKFDRSGENITTQYSNEDERNIRNGFINPSETGLFFTGSLRLLSGVVPLPLAGTKSDISNDNYSEYNLSVDKKCNAKVAGILSVMKIIQKAGIQVTGNQLQKLIIRRDPTSPVNNASFFKAIGQVELFKNENGIVTLQTVGGKPILYKNLKWEDGAGFIISAFNNGDMAVSVISGIQKVAIQVSLPLNRLLIDCSSGNLILDYDHDHTIKTVSLGLNISGNEKDLSLK